MEEKPKPGGIKVFRRPGSITENTVGRLARLPAHLLLATPEAILKSPSGETAEFIRERYKNVPWKGQVEVYLGHSPLLKHVRRLFQKERRASLLLRIFPGIPTTILWWLSGKFGRNDAYNPFTESAQVYHSNRAVGMHETGHAQDFDRSRFPGLRALAYGLPLAGLKLEWNASHNAMKHLEPKERKDAAKVLEPAFGTYVGAFLGALATPFKTVYGVPLALVPLLAGHIHARDYDQNIFIRKNRKRE